MVINHGRLKAERTALLLGPGEWEEAGHAQGVQLLLKTGTNTTTLFFKDAKTFVVLLNTRSVSGFTSGMKLPVLSPVEESEDTKQWGKCSQEPQEGPWGEATLHSCPGTSPRPLKELLCPKGCPHPHSVEFP